MKLTTTKIAELAGVSRGAVDKTIHNRPGVREDVRRRILQVIEETGYIPLSERKKERVQTADKTVAVILPRLSNPYFAVLKRYMEEICAFMPALHLEFYPCDTTNVRELLSVLDELADKPIDGYLFRGVRSEQIRETLDRHNRPVIFFDSDVTGANRLCLVGEDCVKSGRLAASLLAKSIGCRGQVAVISGSMDIPSHQQRMNGFCDVMREEYPDIHIVRQFYTQEQSAVAYQQTTRLLEDFSHLAGVCNLAGCSGEIGQASKTDSFARVLWHGKRCFRAHPQKGRYLCHQSAAARAGTYFARNDVCVLGTGQTAGKYVYSYADRHCTGRKHGYPHPRFW